MTGQDVVVEIARCIGSHFLEFHSPSKGHDLVVHFETTSVLPEMEIRGLCKTTNNRTDFLASSGTFAVLPSDDQLYKRAEIAFVSTVRVLRHLFCRDPPTTQYSEASLLEVAAAIGESLDSDKLSFGLYLCQDFGVLRSPQLAPDGITIVECAIADRIINMKDPERDWTARAQNAKNAREAMHRPPVPIDVSQIAFPEGTFGDDYPEEGDQSGLWSLLHPSIIVEARKRYRVGLYAEAVLAALKVVSHRVKALTGLDLDGAPLMNKAFSPTHPHLLFDTARTETGRSTHQGYMQIFAGTMSAVRNPKAHSLAEITQDRCIHFLFLASLLAHKLDEAQPASSCPVDIM
jgi:uncharacterized protein (TIGR02391 family)